MLPRILAPVLATFLVGITGAVAQEFPNRPIALLVGFAAGGGVDIVARAVGARLQAQLGQPIVIENRPGANSSLAAVTTARAKPDGYTLLVGANGMTTNAALYPSAGFDVERDFTPVSTLGEAPPVLAAGPGFSGASLKDLIAQAKAKPGDLAYGSPGAGSSAHLAMELFQRSAGIQLRHVAYRSGTLAITDAMGGNIPLLAVNLPEVVGQAKAGTLKMLGVTSRARNPLLPDIATVAEQGFAGFEASTWWALFAPAGTPPDVVAKLSAETRKALASPELRQNFLNLGGVATGSTPEEMKTFIAGEHSRWSKIIAEAKITAE
jgi:tripartite-type tricarboxylate transporter receptor subunit TctC